MAFNIDIPGPKLINTNFSQSLGELGQIFGQIRENAVIRDTLAGMQSDDPVSVDQTISKLLMTGRTGRDLALKLQEQQDRIRQRALQERGLGVQERGVAVREGELGRGLTADKEAREERARVLREQEQFDAEDKAIEERKRQERENRRRGQPSATGVPLTPSTPVPSTDWRSLVDPDVAPSPQPVPRPQSSLPSSGLQQLASTQIEAPDTRDPTSFHDRTRFLGGNLPVAPAMDEQPPIGPAPSVPARDRGPQFAQVAGATATDATTAPAPAPPQPAAGGIRAGTLQEPEIQPPSEEEQDLLERADRLRRRAERAGNTPTQATNYRAAAAAVEKQAKELGDQREKIYNRRLQTWEAARGRAESGDVTAKTKLTTEVETKSKMLAQEKNILNLLEKNLQDPKYKSGWIGALQQFGSEVLSPVEEAFPNLPGVLINREATREGIHKPATVRRNIDALMKQSVILQAGPKGLATIGFTDKDQKIVAEAFTTTGDPRETSILRVRVAQAITDRKMKELEIETNGLNRGLTTPQISKAIIEYNKDNPLFMNADGSYTKLGRELSPMLTGGEERKPAVQQPPVGAPDAEGWTPLPGGGRIRVKP